MTLHRYGWHSTKKGQVLQGNVLHYGREAVLDNNEKPCPLVVLKLTEQTSSFSKSSECTHLSKGEVVALTCSQAALKRGIERVNPKPGDVLWISLTDLQKISTGMMQVFAVQKVCDAKGNKHE